MPRFRICVFCGASSGASPEYGRAAQELGRQLARHDIGTVYGAGGVGIMGALSDAVLEAGGEVVGVIPQDLMDREHGRRDLTELHVVGSMHDRKALMHELSEAFVVLPGGLGTFEEMFEISTWAQLGLHAKPIVAVDAGGYFGPLRVLLDHGVAEGFIRPADRDLIDFVDSPADVLPLLDGLG
jgi:uncharacterized protein (TIGR00730 family)